jgi:hypothetical protein
VPPSGGPNASAHNPTDILVGRSEVSYKIGRLPGTLEIAVLERDTVIQKERIVFSADIANAVTGIERAALCNDN